MDIENLHSDYISGMRIDESFGKYRLSCKAGTYCVFGFEQISNQRHQHNCYEMCIIISGEGSYFYNNTVYRIQRGDIIIAEPEIQHEIQANIQESLLLLYIFIEIKCNSSAAKVKTFGDQCIEGFLNGHVQKTVQEQLLAYITFIEAYNSPRKKYHFGTYEALKNLILESLLSLSNKSKSQDTPVVKNIIENSMDYIDANLHKRILVKDIAANSCTTGRNLEYLFRKHLNKTVVGYINEKKIELACHYLNMYFNISDTASMVGINNLSQFSSLFRKYKTVSPKQYQQINLTDKMGMGRRI
jgi:AraC family transcriptional regulator, transcriptional activator of pobA